MTTLDPHDAPIYAAVHGTTGTFTVEGAVQIVTGADDREVRSAILGQATARAQLLGRPVVLVTEDDLGRGQLHVHPDGTVEERGAFIPSPAEPAAPASAPVDGPPEGHHGIVDAEIPAPPVPTPAPASPAPADGEAVLTRREARQSFLTREEVEEPATQGLRGALARIGIRVSPSDAERLERDWTRLVSQHWHGPRTIAVVNGKGGVGKTMTTICLSSVFARYGGAGVLAWDNNQTRGTLGWSTEQGSHDASILDLLPQVERLLGTGAQSADLAYYVHHQTRDRYDVLRSKPEVLATEQRFDATTVDSIHAVAAKFYRLVFIDSGNDETDPMWLRAIERGDQIVVPTIGEAKAAESAALLVEGLAARGGHFKELADKAVVVVSKHKHDLPDAELSKIADGFKSLAHDVVTIPYDPALGAGILNYGSLRPATQRAWLAAGAAVARGL
jgi:MinD-like ATPase involved in chromosome partitioning or flagellar assembly